MAGDTCAWERFELFCGPAESGLSERASLAIVSTFYRIAPTSESVRTRPHRSPYVIHLLIRKVVVRVRRFAFRALKAIQPDRIQAFTLPGGGRFEYPLASAIGEDLFAGWFEPAEVAFVVRHLRPGDVVLDVGANAGLYTVIAARAVGDTGHVYAFEPDQRAVALLRRNVALNGLKNVTVIEAAVSDQTGEREFAAASDIALSSLAAIQRDDQHIQGWRTVRTIRLDDAIASHAIAGVTFLKIDVEGAEKLVIDGAPNLLARAPEGFTILFEGFDRNTEAFRYTVRQLLELLQLEGFALQGFDPSLQLQPVDAGQLHTGTPIYNFVARKKLAE